MAWCSVTGGGDAVLLLFLFGEIDWHGVERGLRSVYDWIGFFGNDQ